MPDKRKYAVLITNRLRGGHSQILFGPFDTIKEVADWASTAAINVPYWSCHEMIHPDDVDAAAAAMTAPDIGES